jgi:ADP-ribosylglycohydrolase
MDDGIEAIARISAALREKGLLPQMGQDPATDALDEFLMSKITKSDLSRHSQVSGALFGLAIGDALGAPLEFSSAQDAKAAADIGLEMTGGGPWKPGQWTDDTAMALALGESIIDKGLLDTADVARRYIAWAEGGPPDIGTITRSSLVGARDDDGARQRAKAQHDETGMTAGNGTVMRVTPIALAARSVEEASVAARADAVLTHHDPVAGAASAAICAALMAIRDGSGDPIGAAETQIGDHGKLQEVLRAVRDKDEDCWLIWQVRARSAHAGPHSASASTAWSRSGTTPRE